MIQREDLAGQNRLPRFVIRACSALVKHVAEQSCLLPFEGPGGRRDYYLLIPSQLRVLCRGKEFFPKFLEGSIRCLKRFWAGFRVCRVEQANQRSFDRSSSVSLDA